jgi:hypothetical protein
MRRAVSILAAVVAAGAITLTAGVGTASATTATARPNGPSGCCVS